MEFILIFFVVCYAVVAFQFGHKVAIKRIPILLICIALAIGLVALKRLVPPKQQDYVWSGFFIIFCLFVWAGIASFFVRAKKAGKVLLKLGRPASRPVWV